MTNGSGDIANGSRCNGNVSRCKRTRSPYSVNEGDRFAVVSQCIGDELGFLGNAIARVYTSYHKVCFEKWYERMQEIAQILQLGSVVGWFRISCPTRLELKFRLKA